MRGVLLINISSINIKVVDLLMFVIFILLKFVVCVVIDWKKEFLIFLISFICCIVLNCFNKKNVIVFIIIRILVVVKINLECKDNLFNFL